MFLSDWYCPLSSQFLKKETELAFEKKTLWFEKKTEMMRNVQSVSQEDEELSDFLSKPRDTSS
jgi:hypothetical protein